MTPHVSITLLRTQTDERLVELIAAGHDRAFDAVVDRYRRPLMRYARRFVSEDARAEDVVQAAFLSAWAALREGTPVRDLRPWLYRIVHNGALNVMKKPGGEDAPLIEASDLRPGPAAEVEQREDVRRALDTIAGLPERQRAALLAVALEGRTHADVGEDLGINDTAVRQLVSRARASLRVAATAITPWPAAVWLAGAGGAASGETAARIGEVVGGGVVGGGALKAGAVIAAAGAVAVSVPQVSHVVRVHRHPAKASASQVRDTAPVRDGALTLSAGSPDAAQLGGRSGTTRVVVNDGRRRRSAEHPGDHGPAGIAPGSHGGEDHGGPPAGAPREDQGRPAPREDGSGDGRRRGSDAAPRPESGRTPSGHSGPGDSSPEPADDHAGQPAVSDGGGDSGGPGSGSPEPSGSGHSGTGSGSGTSGSGKDAQDPPEAPEAPESRSGHGGDGPAPAPVPVP